VVAVAHEDPLVEPGRALALLALEWPSALRDVGGELIEIEAAQRPGVARVAGEERSLDRLRQVDEREHRAIQVREVGGEESPFLFCEFLDRVAHGLASLASSSDRLGSGALDDGGPDLGQRSDRCFQSRITLFYIL